ncbi:TatD family hydrolase [Halochromatium salexigens]|uniref:DNAase n=1 Tax=Halochromatium salexigens TaxID=49447 RepID=A0AAJ0UI60_HALSE|nr:TatD family hydrolase [Halochromatium salexigens]MBK5931914.1 DNAase [Halochromatium salexigens]
MRLIDTHCHLDVADFDADRAEVLTAARAAGVEAIVVPGIDAGGWDRLLGLCAGDEGLYPALGLHPVYLERHRDGDLAALERRLETDTPVAVGEIGLDFHAKDADRERQLDLCRAQLALARDARLPVLLHVRKAHEEMLRLLTETPVIGGSAHAFNGSLQQARRYIEHGFCLGFGGMLTFERSTRLRRLAAELPFEAIVLETDAPDLTVASHQYQRNSPAYLPEVLSALAEVRQAAPAALAAQTTANARRLLRLETEEGRADDLGGG